MTITTQAAGCDESIEVFRRVDGVSILVDLVVGRSKRARENIVVALLNLVKSNGDKTIGDIKEVDRADATMRALADNDNGVSTRGNSKMEALLRVLESKPRS
ncbi:unnamed protein product [Musa acuminata subsp. burmannicoides]